jgi:hypothetical protein
MGNVIKRDLIGSPDVYFETQKRSLQERIEKVKLSEGEEKAIIESKKGITRYDDRGNVIEKSGYTSEGRLDYKWTYRYDPRGNCVEWSFYNSDDKVEGKISYNYQYDTKGNWLVKICYIDNIPKYIYEREIEYYE